MPKPKVFQINFDSTSTYGIDVVVCEKQEQIQSVMESRGYTKVVVEEVKELSLQQIKVEHLTVGDLLKLIQAMNRHEITP
jgi:hypothetical protein